MFDLSHGKADASSKLMKKRIFCPSQGKENISNFSQGKRDISSQSREKEDI